jgi:L-lactate dehydrogenase (cytochrome)
VRSGFSRPLRPSWPLAWQCAIHPRWFFGMFVRSLLTDGMPHFENMGYRTPLITSKGERDRGRRDRMSWKHVEMMRKMWKGKFVLKGILSREDARIARESGVDGVLVSNHGGRQLDSSAAPLRVLPGIVDAAGDMTVMMDSGVRRGTDVLKALALGAKFVFVGRPFLYAAAMGGEPGVRHAIKLLREEVDRDMALLGISSLGEMNHDLMMEARGKR